MEGVETVTQEIARLGSGEIVGEIPLLNVRAISTTVKAVENSLILLISQKELTAKLQQDIGFAARFYRAIAKTL